MSLNDLATSQPEPEVTTPSEEQEAMVQTDGEQASATLENVDGEQQEGTEQQEQTRTQKRINALTGEKRQLQEELIKERSAREAIERMGNTSKDDSDRKLSDLDSTQLREFINKARGNEDLSEFIPEAEDLLIEKRVDEKLSKFQDNQDSKQSEVEGLQLTNVMLSNLAGNKLDNQDGEYFTNVQSNMLDLGSDKFANVNKDQLLAVSLAEIAYLKKQANGPSMNDRVVNNVNNNNRINANSGSTTSTGGDIPSMLEQSGGSLSRSTQGQTGALRDVIKQLNAVKGLKQGG